MQFPMIARQLNTFKFRNGISAILLANLYAPVANGILVN